jgi:hypothetical protein
LEDVICINLLAEKFKKLEVETEETGTQKKTRIQRADAA